MTALEVMDGAAIRRWCRLAADALDRASAAIDALNVFPVPDADTGTNLRLTMRSAAEAVEALPDVAAAGQLWQAAARGAMLGAAGNSGTILSQLLRGLSDVCAPAGRCDGQVVAAALGHAAVIARAAVSRPVDGTVLTVADAAAEAAAQAAQAAAQAAAGAGAGAGAGPAAASDLPAVVAAAARAARAALAGTSAQLDVLAACGVVDAGGAGLCVLLDALAGIVTGTDPPAAVLAAAIPAARPVPPAGAASAPPGRAAPDPAAGSAPGPGSGSGPRPGSDPGLGRGPGSAPGPGRAPGPGPGRYGYEVIYLLEAEATAVAELRAALDSLGDSVVIVGGERLWHVHVHLADAGAAIEAGIRAGRPSRIAVTYLDVGPAGSEAPTAGSAALAVTACGPAGSLAGADQIPVAGADRAQAARPAVPRHASSGGRAVIAVAEGDGPAGLLHRAGAWVLRGDRAAGPGVGPATSQAADSPADSGVSPAADPGAPGLAAAFLTAARRAGREVIIVPNAHSVATAARAAAATLGDEGLTVAVIGSVSPLQALAAMAVHLPLLPFEADVAAMERAAAGLRYGSVIRRGDNLAGLISGQVTVTGASAAQVAIEVAEALMTGGGELVTLMAEGAPDSELPRAVAAHLAGRWPGAEIVCYGGGPVPLLVGVE